MAKRFRRLEWKKNRRNKKKRGVSRKLEWKGESLPHPDPPPRQAKHQSDLLILRERVRVARQRRNMRIVELCLGVGAVAVYLFIEGCI